MAAIASQDTLDCPIHVDKDVILEPTSVILSRKKIVTLFHRRFAGNLSSDERNIQRRTPLSSTRKFVLLPEIRHIIVGSPYGSLEGSKIATEFVPHELLEEHPFSIAGFAATLMCNADFNVMIGRWNLVGQPTAIFFEVQSAYHIFHCKELLQKDGGLKIQESDFLAKYGLVFGFLVGHFIAMVRDIANRQAAPVFVNKDPVLVQFYEWS